MTASRKRDRADEPAVKKTRLTSGILMFSKCLSKAQQIEKQIRNKTVTKTYLARVKGEFPKDRIDCNEPIVIVSHKLGVCHVDPSGKPCSTSFIRLHYDGNTSLVKCLPKTGRMHQIRVHLQWLGYPIINDPLYNHPAWGPETGRNGEGIKSIDEVLSKIVESRFLDDVIISESEMASQEEAPKPDLAAKDDSVIVESTGSDDVSKGSEDITRPNDTRTEEVTKTKSGDTLITVSEDVNKPNDTGSGNITRSNDTGSGDITGSNDISAGSTDVTTITGLSITTTSIPVTVTSSNNNNCIVTSDTTTCHNPTGLNKDPDCTECTLSRVDPTRNDLVMYLHALNYSGQGWEYSTEPPYWADENWIPNEL